MKAPITGLQGICPSRLHFLGLLKEVWAQVNLKYFTTYKAGIRLEMGNYPQEKLQHIQILSSVNTKRMNSLRMFQVQD